MKKQDAPTISKEDAEEFSQSLGQIVTGSYRQILLADKMQVPQVLGFPSLRDWVNEKIGGYIKYSIDERHKIAEELNGEGLSQHTIAAVLGVTEGTISKDLKASGIPRRPYSKRKTNLLKAKLEESAPEVGHFEKDEFREASQAHENQLPQRKKSAAEIEVELHRAADQGVEALVWDKVKDRFLPFWENLLNSLEEDERPFLIWAVHSFADQYEEKRANQ